ncbi:histidine--tRNA ligase [Candidatus Woesearchaeota archaeon]|nr:histidine--tRNA ligase [Candidatus Woesearchaeota archaeon]
MKKPKGTEDFFPEEMEIRNSIFNLLRNIAGKYGYKEVSSPAFESLDLLTRKEGKEIKEQIFTLEKRGRESLGLRFDLTVPMARMFISRQKSLPKPVKWFSTGRMWRYEQPQKGRLREFYQMSVELFGAGSIYADAEIISLAIDCLVSLGLTEKDFYVKLNSRGLLQAILLQFIPASKLENVIRLIDKREKIGREEFNRELKKETIAYDKINSLLDKGIEDIKPANKDIKNSLDEMKGLMSMLGNKRKFLRFDLSTARGLAYYTGTVFEVFDTGNKYRAIIGGGRYDNLVGMFGGQKAPATGFGLGYATLLLLLEDKGIIPKAEKGVDFYIAPVSGKETGYALQAADNLRNRYCVEVDLMGRNLGNQFKYADKIKARKVIVIGEKELMSGKLTVKDMVSGREQRLSLEDI